MTSQNRKRVSPPVYRPGLRNVISGETRICNLDARKKRLEYCGYSIEDLVAHASFEQVAWLLLFGELPTRKELECLGINFRRFQKEAIIGFWEDDYIKIVSFCEVEYLKRVLKLHGTRSHPMDMLRSLVSVFGAHDSTSPPVGIPLIASMPIFVAAIGRYLEGTLDNYSSVKRFYGTDHSSIARVFLEFLRGVTATAEEVRALDTSLILYAEHEFNLGTHVVHAITSSNSDLYSAICGAIGGLKGNLHGGANEAVLDLLKEIGS